MCAGAHTSLSLPLSAAIDLHEIHLAPQSSLQVPVGHIPVPGGIKLCSPGTFLVANYLIINNGSCQVNFTKPIGLLSHTPTHSDSARMPPRCLWAGWPCRRPVRRTLSHAEMALRYLWAGVPCRRPVRSSLSPRGDAPEVPVGRDAVPKTRQKNALPREDATEVLVGKVAVPKGALAELIEL